jgi:ABC-type glycerol-3-phosphate transport system substrate-binding protein
MKKLMLLVMVLALVTTMLIGCASADPPASDESKEATNPQSEASVSESKANEPVTLSILACAGAMADALEAIAPQLKDEGIILDIQSFDWATYEGKAKLAATSEGGEYDLMFVPGLFVETFAKSNAIIDISDVVDKVYPDKSDLYNSVIKFSTLDSKYYMCPLTAEGMVYYYRTDLIDQVPDTIDEMYETGKALTSGDMYGLAIPGGPGEGACSFFSYFLWSYGGVYFDESWEPQLNTPEAAAAAAMFAKIDQDCAPQGVTTWQNEETVAAFQSGNLASMIMWPGFYSMINDPEQSAVVGKFAMAPVPAGPAGAAPRFGTWGIAVTTNCKDVAAAKRVCELYSSEENVTELGKSVVTCSKKINAKEEVRAANPSVEPCAGALDDADERPGIPEASLYIPAVGAAINSIIAGAPVQETLDALNEEVRGFMVEGGYYS